MTLHPVELDIGQIAAAFAPERLAPAYQELIKAQDIPGARKMLEAPTAQERASGKLEYLRASLCDAPFGIR